MAKIKQQLVVISLSKLVRDNEQEQVGQLIDHSTLVQLEEIIHEMLNDSSVVVEINPESN